MTCSKVKTDSLPTNKRKLPTLEWGNSYAVKVGDCDLAIGNPFGLGSTVTSGIISDGARDIMLVEAVVGDVVGLMRAMLMILCSMMPLSIWGIGDHF